MARNPLRRNSRPTTFARPHMRLFGANRPAALTPTPSTLRITSPNPLHLSVGQTSQASWDFLDEDDVPVPAIRVVDWTSSLATVASVTSVGVIAGLGAGATVLTVSSAVDNLSSTLTVNVSAPIGSASSIEILQSSIAFRSGKTTLASCYVFDSTNTYMANQTVTWSSSNTNFFTVGSDVTTLDPLHQVVLTAQVPSAQTSTATLTASA